MAARTISAQPIKKANRAKTVKIVTAPVHEVSEKSFQLAVIIISVLGGVIIAGVSSWFINKDNVTSGQVKDMIETHPVIIKQENLATSVGEMKGLLSNINQKINDVQQQNAALKQQVDDQGVHIREQIGELKEDIKDVKKK